jgi:transcriptional regulator with XRE-family HTH domain
MLPARYFLVMQTATQSTLREIRESRGLKQSGLGIHAVVASRIECGHQKPTSKTLDRILSALNAADPAHPVSRVELVAACRASQVVARSARRRPRRGAASAEVVGSGAAALVACPDSAKGGAA